jgi:quercetin dioxygenase-like cupin family protein
MERHNRIADRGAGQLRASTDVSAPKLQQHISNVIYRIAEGTLPHALDVFGPTVEFLRWPDDPDADFCVMRGMVPPGITVPLHSHDDAEDFYILAGTQQVLTQGNHGLEWRDAHAGDYVRVPGGIPHAHRNVSDQPAIDLIVTTARLGRFFLEVGRPVTGTPQPPTPDEIGHFVAVAANYGYTLGTPEENAGVGIETPDFTANA